MPTFSTTYAVADIDADFGITKVDRDLALALLTPEEVREGILGAMQNLIQLKLEQVKPAPWVKPAGGA